MEFHRADRMPGLAEALESGAVVGMEEVLILSKVMTMLFCLFKTL